MGNSLCCPSHEKYCCDQLWLPAFSQLDVSVAPVALGCELRLCMPSNITLTIAMHSSRLWVMMLWEISDEHGFPDLLSLLGSPMKQKDTHNSGPTRHGTKARLVGLNISEEPLQGSRISGQLCLLPYPGPWQLSAGLFSSLRCDLPVPATRHRPLSLIATELGPRQVYGAESTSYNVRTLVRTAGEVCKRSDSDSACNPGPLRLRGCSAHCCPCLATARQPYTVKQAHKDAM